MDGGNEKLWYSLRHLEHRIWRRSDAAQPARNINERQNPIKDAFDTLVIQALDTK